MDKLVRSYWQRSLTIEHKHQQLRPDDWTGRCCIRCRCGRRLGLRSSSCEIGRQRLRTTTAAYASSCCTGTATTRTCTGSKAGTAHQRNVLLAVEHIGDRRAHTSAQTGLDFEQLLAFVCAVSHHTSIINHLED